MVYRPLIRVLCAIGKVPSSTILNARVLKWWFSIKKIRENYEVYLILFANEISMPLSTVTYCCGHVFFYQTAKKEQLFLICCEALTLKRTTLNSFKNIFIAYLHRHTFTAHAHCTIYLLAVWHVLHQNLSALLHPEKSLGIWTSDAGRQRVKRNFTKLPKALQSLLWKGSTANPHCNRCH